MRRARLGFWQIWNMSFGFLGLQFGWGLQMGNMSAIYEYLGANPHELPILWLAAPLSGLFVQPLIGHFSDRTWGPLGRRRPYFLTGALLSSTALVLMPNATGLLMAAVLLWILDCSINVSMEPFRAFVADLLPEEQRTEGFAMQSLFIGLGGTLGSAMPWLMRQLKVTLGQTASGPIPLTVRLSFYIGAAAFLGAVLWTVFTTPEYPPEDMAAFERAKQESRGAARAVRDILSCIREMPQVMRQLAWVQIFTWLGLFCMWLFFVPTIARDVFQAVDERSARYHEGAEFGSLCFGVYSIVCFAFSFALPRLAQRLGRKWTHALCLSAGGVGLLSVGPIAQVHLPGLLILSMVGVGIAWASILAMPYALLAGSLPADRTGTYMGIFNFFIVIPEICNALGFGWVMEHILHDNRLAAVLGGGLFLFVAAALVLRVHEVGTAGEPAKAMGH
jgi:maltose/moltooligosaccharide transporter